MNSIAPIVSHYLKQAHREEKTLKPNDELRCGNRLIRDPKMRESINRMFRYPDPQKDLLYVKYINGIQPISLMSFLHQAQRERSIAQKEILNEKITNGSYKPKSLKELRGKLSGLAKDEIRGICRRYVRSNLKQYKTAKEFTKALKFLRKHCYFKKKGYNDQFAALTSDYLKYNMAKSNYKTVQELFNALETIDQDFFEGDLAIKNRATFCYFNQKNLRSQFPDPTLLFSELKTALDKGYLADDQSSNLLETATHEYIDKNLFRDMRDLRNFLLFAEKQVSLNTKSRVKLGMTFIHQRINNGFYKNSKYNAFQSDINEAKRNFHLTVTQKNFLNRVYQGSS